MTSLQRPGSIVVRRARKMKPATDSTLADMDSVSFRFIRTGSLAPKNGKLGVDYSVQSEKFWRRGASSLRVAVVGMQMRTPSQIAVHRTQTFPGKTSIEQDRMQTAQVDRRAISVWRWQALIVTALATVAAGVFFFPFDQIAWQIPVVAVALIGSLIAWSWPPTYYRHLRYAVDDTGIVIQRGVLWRSHIALPRVRIQHTDVMQGPLQRRFDVGTLRLYTAGSRHTMIELPGLAHQDAIELRNALLAESMASGV